MATATSWITRRPQADGLEACIRDTNINVWGLVGRKRMGWSDARILRNVEGLRPEDLEVAWEYTAKNAPEIGRHLDAQKGFRQDPPMTYSDFEIDTVVSTLGVKLEPADLFGSLAPMEVPSWLRAWLDRGQRQVLLSEKARSEFLVVPILLACQDLLPGSVTIYSGVRLDVDPERGLIGECDFILTPNPPLPALRAPLVAVLEAKKHDIEDGTWQCFAQMGGARLFNERAHTQPAAVYGCVTTGEAWQFLRLKDNVAAVDQRRYYIDNPGGILAVFQRILADAP